MASSTRARCSSATELAPDRVALLQRDVGAAFAAPHAATQIGQRSKIRGNVDQIGDEIDRSALQERVLIGGDAHTARPCLVDHGHDAAHLVPVVATGGLQVGDLHRHARLFADADDLVGGLEDAPRLIAYVRDVHAAELGYGLGDGDHLLGADVDIETAVLEAGLMPQAPSLIPWLTIDRIRAISSGVAPR